MAKKKKNKEKKTSVKPEKKTHESKPEEFDFGGIPDRDLKKNLGCG